jgi:hypothetical protein
MSKLNRRSFLARVCGSAGLGLGALAIVTGSARSSSPDHDPTDRPERGRSQNRTGHTDTDSGRNGDRSGYGRSGFTDHDGQDLPNYGLGPPVPCSDLDRAPNGDHALAGRCRGVQLGANPNATGHTDTDDSADRANYGRTGVTDRDSGPTGGILTGDLPGYGRGRRT